MKFGQFVALSTKNLFHMKCVPGQGPSLFENPPYLKLGSTTFCQMFIFSPNNCFSKTMKNVFNFIEKTVFILQDIKIFVIFSFFSTLFRFKRKNGSGIIHDDMNWLAQICKSNFWNNSKLLYIT